MEISSHKIYSRFEFQGIRTCYVSGQSGLVNEIGFLNKFPPRISTEIYSPLGSCDGDLLEEKIVDLYSDSKKLLASIGDLIDLRDIKGDFDYIMDKVRLIQAEKDPSEK